MADAYPNLSPELARPSVQSNDSTPVNQSVQNARNAVANNASSAIDAIANHPVTQSITSGPLAQSAKDQVNQTSNELSNVAASRKIPQHRAATGQQLTHYHSMFYNILSWENPRVTSIVYAALVSFFFFTRYVPLISMLLKSTYVILGIIAASEIAGKLIFDRGLATQMRPRKYYTFPRENLERNLEDVEQLVNFFVIEAQRIVFAENIYATVAAFTAALSFYLLKKVTPTWGLGLISTTAIFFIPLIYTTNKELIDTQLAHAQTVINEQATQVREVAAQHTGRAAEVAKNTASQYTAKAQELIGQAKSKAASPEAPNPANLNPVKDEPKRDLKADFPSAPTDEPTRLDKMISETVREEENEPLLAQ